MRLRCALCCPLPPSRVWPRVSQSLLRAKDIQKVHSSILSQPSVVRCPLACLTALCRWVGARITFGFLACPGCKQDMNHPIISSALAPYLALREDILTKVAPLSCVTDACFHDVFSVRPVSVLSWSLVQTFPSLLPVRSFPLDHSFARYLSCFILQAAHTLKNLKNSSSESLRECPWMTHLCFCAVYYRFSAPFICVGCDACRPATTCAEGATSHISGD